MSSYRKNKFRMNEEIESVSSTSDFSSFPNPQPGSNDDVSIVTTKEKKPDSVNYADMSSTQRLRQTAVDLEVIVSCNRKKRAKTRMMNKEKKLDIKQQLLEFCIVRESQRIIDSQKKILTKNAAVASVKKETPFDDLSSNQENTSPLQASTSSNTVCVPTPSPTVTNAVAQFDYIQGRNLFGPRQFCLACGHIYGRFGIKCAEL